MKLLGGLLGLIIIICVGGFVYLSIADVPIEQTNVTKPVQIEGNQN